MRQNSRPFFIFIAVISLTCSQAAFSTPPEFDYFEFAAVENFHSDKKWCDENYPEFKNQNELTFGQSIYSKTTGEAFIKTNAPAESQQRLLAALPHMRADRREEYKKMPSNFLKTMCSSFEQHMGKESMQPKNAKQ